MGSSLSCPPDPHFGVVAEPISGSLTFQDIMTITAWVCFGVTLLLWLGLAIPHLRRYKAPNEQRQILRIISMPVWFTIVALIVLHVYKAAQYVEPLANLYEAYAMASLFLLYVHYVAPEAHTRAEFFQNLQTMTKSGAAAAGGSLHWFRVCQLELLSKCVTLILSIEILEDCVSLHLAIHNSYHYPRNHASCRCLLQDIIEAKICSRLASSISTCCNNYGLDDDHPVPASSQGLHAQTQRISEVDWLQAACSSHYSATCEPLNKPPKLVGFMLMMLLQFIFSILASHVHGNSKVTYANIIIGLPQMIISIECAIFMVGFYFTFHSKEYRQHTGDPRGAKGTTQALLHAINPIDLIHGVWLCFTPMDGSDY
jgi:hypothetical protein